MPSTSTGCAIAWCPKRRSIRFATSSCTVADWIARSRRAVQRRLRSADARPRTRHRSRSCAPRRVLRTGFHERLHTWWPGLEEVTGVDGGAETTAGRDAQPVLVTPPGSAVEEPWWTVRDREEELVAIARQIKAAERERRGGSVEPHGGGLQGAAAVSLPCGRSVRRVRHRLRSVRRAPARRRTDCRRPRPRARCGGRELHAEHADRAASFTAFRVHGGWRCRYPRIDQRPRQKPEPRALSGRSRPP